MRGGFQMVARIPYPATIPKYFVLACEVATMSFLRSSGLPIPSIYGYSPTPDNAAETEDIFMEFVQGTELSDVWLDLEEQETISVLRQLVQLEAKMMSIAFPDGGSLYYAHDLEKVGRDPGIPLDDERFCVGPDTRLPLWFGRRSQLDVDRGPYVSAEAALVTPANKELAYLEQFGQPLLPFQRIRREGYQYQEQLPNPALGQFRIHHPDLQQSNIIVLRSPDSGQWQVAGLFDWQYASILPVFLFAGVPQRLQNLSDPVSHSMTRPALPENFADLDEPSQNRARALYRRRLVHYHYVRSTEDCNALHYAALTDPVGVLRRRLFCHASDPWEGETLELKAALVEATENWETLSGGGVPCPVVFDPEDVRATKALEEVQTGPDESMEMCQNMVGFGPEGWVPTEHYEEAMRISRQVKEDTLARGRSEEERAEILAHWPLDDMDEEKYT